MLNSRQRAQLRGMANSMETIFQVGKGGINEQLIKHVNEALEARELIKIRTLETAPAPTKEIANEIANFANADVVQVIGSKFILYKQSKDNKKIVLVK